MSFTIKCDKCGNEQIFKEGDNPIGEHIEISVTESCGFSGCEVVSKDISCNKCYNYISL